jgi:SAM-dependent methyltransferase
MPVYDDAAGQFDRRYEEYDYGDIERALLAFLGSSPLGAILEIGCGTGHWLQSMSARARLLAGLDESAGMLRRARDVAPGVHLVRARAEQLPWCDGAFDRVVCITVLHQIAGRREFLREVRRLVKPGGGLLTIDLDPHADWDHWWVYDYFDPMRAIDLARYGAVRDIRGDLVLAGFDSCTSYEAARIEQIVPVSEARARGIVSRGVTTHLKALSDTQYNHGIERLWKAESEAGASDAELQLVTDLRFYAVEGWT